jgi:hypothetical protein
MVRSQALLEVGEHVENIYSHVGPMFWKLGVGSLNDGCEPAYSVVDC